MFELVYWTYCGQYCFCTTGADKHKPSTRVCRSIPLYNLRGATLPESPVEAPPLSGSLDKTREASGVADGGVNPK